MTGSKNSDEHENNIPAKVDSGDESEDESEVLEESPCGRWQKRREEVTQRDVPGIDSAFLAMDTEEGVEVVWNEVRVSEKKASKAQFEKIKQVFDNLIQLDHVNIVKFHNYWTDMSTDNKRVIFITEYMSSGSLKQFLKKTKKNNKTIKVMKAPRKPSLTPFTTTSPGSGLKAWKRWCTQILSALSYLHSCTPPIIHGNLTTDTIFIQHNGLIKIGSVAPDAIYNHVKTYKQEQRNMHYIAPEYAALEPVSTAVDIYSFGVCALEMAALEIPGNGDTGQKVTEESIQNTLKTLDDPLQRDFITRCLERDKSKRPSARELLFHAVLFEVHSLKLLAAHTHIKHASALPESDTYQYNVEPSQVIAEIKHADGRKSHQITVGEVTEKTYGKGQFSLEIEKFLEDVRNGVYPLTAFASIITPPQGVPRSVTPELAESDKSETPEPADIETRKILSMKCQILKQPENANYMITILLRMDDKMNRQLTGELTDKDEASDLADELVAHCLINPEDREAVAKKIQDVINDSRNAPPTPHSAPPPAGPPPVVTHSNTLLTTSAS